jgi:DNA-binding XRE family transcriptional regulator
MTPAERAEYYAASFEAEARLKLAEIVHTARTADGLSQTKLARRAGTRQAVISAIESGVQAPGGVMLVRIAHAVGGSPMVRRCRRAWCSGSTLTDQNRHASTSSAATHLQE